MNAPPPDLTLAEAATALGVAESTLLRMAEAGTIRVVAVLRPEPKDDTVFTRLASGQRESWKCFDPVVLVEVPPNVITRLLAGDAWCINSGKVYQTDPGEVAVYVASLPHQYLKLETLRVPRCDVEATRDAQPKAKSRSHKETRQALLRDVLDSIEAKARAVEYPFDRSQWPGTKAEFRAFLKWHAPELCHQLPSDDGRLSDDLRPLGVNFARAGRARDKGKEFYQTLFSTYPA